MQISQKQTIIILFVSAVIVGAIIIGIIFWSGKKSINDSKIKDSETNSDGSTVESTTTGPEAELIISNDDINSTETTVEPTTTEAETVPIPSNNDIVDKNVQEPVKNDKGPVIISHNRPNKVDSKSPEPISEPSKVSPSDNNATPNSEDEAVSIHDNNTEVGDGPGGQQTGQVITDIADTPSGPTDQKIEEEDVEPKQTQAPVVADSIPSAGIDATSPTPAADVLSAPTGNGNGASTQPADKSSTTGVINVRPDSTTKTDDQQNPPKSPTNVNPTITTGGDNRDTSSIMDASSTPAGNSLITSSTANKGESPLTNTPIVHHQQPPSKLKVDSLGSQTNTKSPATQTPKNTTSSKQQNQTPRRSRTPNRPTSLPGTNTRNPAPRASSTSPISRDPSQRDNQGPKKKVRVSPSSPTSTKSHPKRP
ncbi:hypothetical protein CDIK_1452 [Cucumispora dikerogammari]|nr:hypothetical protein CDIK_1452 [Cucumispora dikerogammari]